MVFFANRLSFWVLHVHLFSNANVWKLVTHRFSVNDFESTHRAEKTALLKLNENTSWKPLYTCGTHFCFSISCSLSISVSLLRRAAAATLAPSVLAPRAPRAGGVDDVPLVPPTASEAVAQIRYASQPHNFSYLTFSQQTVWWKLSRSLRLFSCLLSF